MRHALPAAALLLAPAATLANPPVVAFEVPEERVRVETVARGLEHPWALAFLPDGRMLVTERPGRMRIIGRDGRIGAPISGVPQVAALGQGGLMDVALHPDFRRNGLVFFTYSTGSQEANATALGRGRLDGNRLIEVRELARNPITKAGGQHFGSRLQWMPDGTLLMSVGDGGNPNPRNMIDGRNIRDQAQNPRSWFGAVLRLTADGAAAQGNPGAVDAKRGWDPRVWTIGHRNIQGLARDPKTGLVWATEHGPRGGDELNRLGPGANYGWPVVTHGIEYSGETITNERSRPGMMDPVSVWTPSIAASGLAVYRGTAFGGWDGSLLAGGLMSDDVRRVRIGADGRHAGETRIQIGARVRDVRVGPDGLVYVLTDEPEGRLLRIRPA
jgi:glucose/arabinose dehydrogenase